MQKKLKKCKNCNKYYKLKYFYDDYNCVFCNECVNIDNYTVKDIIKIEPDININYALEFMNIIYDNSEYDNKIYKYDCDCDCDCDHCDEWQGIDIVELDKYLNEDDEVLIF